MLKRPTVAQAGLCLGITPELDPAKIYDVAVVGAGPAGLATAVYAASEGLSVAGARSAGDRRTGRRIGADRELSRLSRPASPARPLPGAPSARRRNSAPSSRIPLEVVRLDCGGPERRDGDPLRLELTTGAAVRARTVVIASGARYRRPDIPNLAVFEGAGVSYWASPVEAKLCEGEEVALVGGGNSAGQAVVFLAPKVKRLHLIVRGAGLEASMSRYLIDRIAALPNVELHAGAEIVGLEGDQTEGLTAAVFRNRATNAEHRCALRHIFLFIGADPNAAWLQDCTLPTTRASSSPGSPCPASPTRIAVPPSPRTPRSPSSWKPSA